MTRTSNMHLLLGLGKPDPKPTPTIQEKHPKKGKFHFTKTLKAVIGIVFIAVVLGSVFAFYHPQPASNPPDDTTPVSSTNPTDNPNSNSTQATQTVTTPPQGTNPPHGSPPPADTSYMIVTNCNGHLTQTEWKKIAEYAWKYFELNTHPTTGLPSSTNDYAIFTDWDIGVYLQAVMDAQKIGVIGTDGTGGSYARIDKILTFLETRPLNETTGYPYWFYGTDGNRSDENSASSVDIADTGRLFVALNNVKNYNTTLYQTRVDNFVYNVNGNRSNYAALVPGVKGEGLSSNSIYAYYVFSGYASFWPTELSSVPNKILDNILSSETLTYYNITLPKTSLTTEPTFSALFELQNPPTKLYTIAEKEYEAHETYFNLTGCYRAFSEGPALDTAWIYELVVDNNKIWAVKQVDGTYSDMTPMIFTKTAFSFLAAYNQPYSVALTVYLEHELGRPDVAGYYSGMSEGGSTLDSCSLHTNGMIITAARYAIQHL